MTDLRQQAINLIEAMPEENLLLIVGMLQGISEKAKPAQKKSTSVKRFWISTWAVPEKFSVPMKMLTSIWRI